MENDGSFYNYLVFITLTVLSQDFVFDVLHKSAASGLMCFHYTQLSFENEFLALVINGHFLGKEVSLLYMITSLYQQAKGKHYSSFICLKSWVVFFFSISHFFITSFVALSQ